MQRYENRRLKQVLRRLRKNLCLCARGESSESGSEYVAKDTSTTSASPAPSFATAQQNTTEETTSLHSIPITYELITTVDHSTAPTDQLAIIEDRSTATSEEFPTTMEQCTATNDQSPTTETIADESSSSVELPTSDGSKAPVTEEIDTNGHESSEGVSIKVNTSNAESSVVPEHATDNETSEVEADNLLVQEVEKFIEKLMDCVVNAMNAEDTALEVPQLPCTSPDLILAPDLDSGLTLSTVESSVTEFYSCHSERVQTDTSLFFSLTSFPSIDEEQETKDCHETLLTPSQSSKEQGSDTSMPELVTCTEEVSSRKESGCNGQNSTISSSDCCTQQCPDSKVTESKVKSSCTCVVTEGQLPSPDFPTKVVLGKRSETCVFQVTLVQGIMGLGLTLGSDDLKELAIQKIRMFSPAATQGQLRIADRILEINGHSVIGKSPSQAQTILSQAKWGEEVTILAMPSQETVVFHFSEMANAGVITMKLNTSYDKPLGVEIEGGSDTECPYIRISAIKCGSVAERCGMLRVGDELLEIDQHLMVGMTHTEAIDILGHISKSITLTVQRRENLNLNDRIQTQKN